MRHVYYCPMRWADMDSLGHVNNVVYVDYLQNIQGKTVAGPYCARAKPGATVSTPLEWSELTDDLGPRDFHLGNAPERFKRIGDIWNEAMRKKNSLRALV